MEGKHPPGCTLISLPVVSKYGFQPAFAMSLINGMLSGTLSNSKFLMLVDHTHLFARNAACQHAVDHGFDYVFFIDSDMDFPVDVLPRLKAVDADVACTDMWSRSIPSFRTVLRLSGADEHGKKTCIAVPDDVAAKKGIEDVDVCGMACTLIKTSLLREMKRLLNGAPWFQSASHGEDASFCFMARELCNAKIKCDFSMIAGHWGTVRMVGQDWSRDASQAHGELALPEMMKRMGVRNLNAPSDRS